MEQLHVWIYYWCMLLDAVLGVLTFGYWQNKFAFDAAVRLSRYRFKKHKENLDKTA